MHGYSKSTVGKWVDYRGKVWPLIQSRRRLKFKYPAHAALRAHVFNRDGYRCVRCGASGINLYDDYDGSETIRTNTFVGSGYRDILVADHILTLKAGGRSVVENLQTLCETCNRKKTIEDRAATAAAGVSL